MARDNTVRVRLTDEELKALKQHAKNKGIPMSEVLRDFVKSLMEK
ncbi:MAG: DUF6290 family protein [Elainellaceae cyanobacterium]